MDAPYSPLEYALLNDWQRGFPLVPRPFAYIGAKVGAGETVVLECLRRLQARGAISRLGAVFAPRRAGASTLAALHAPPQRLDEIAAIVSAHPEVNHNYAREHAWNLWFVVTARNTEVLTATLATIAHETGCPVIDLPLVKEYHIDLGFDLGGAPTPRCPAMSRQPAVKPVERSPEELCLLERLESGLALAPRPYAELAAGCGMTEAAVLQYLAAWQAEGLIKRFGIVVRHHEVGYRANAMVVFALPAERVDAVGTCLSSEAAVTLCYQRRPAPPHWPYNLYCMIHGHHRAEVAPVIERLAARAAARPEVLYSVRRYKQCGARYFAGSAA